MPSPADAGEGELVRIFYNSKSGTINSATLLMSGLIAGPAVSLYGSPTVSAGHGRLVRVRALAANMMLLMVLDRIDHRPL